MPPNSIFPWSALFRAHSHDAPAHREVEKPKPPNATFENPQGSLEHHFKDEAWLKQEQQADAEWIGWLSLYQELWSVTQAVTYMVYSDDAERSVSLQKRNHLTAKIMAESGTKEHGRHRMRKGSRQGEQRSAAFTLTPWSQFDWHSWIWGEAYTDKELYLTWGK